MRKEPAHHFFRLLLSKIPARLSVDFVSKPGAVVNHLSHSHILSESAVFVAIETIILIRGAIGICTDNFVYERHSATLTEFHFHCHLLFAHQSN